MKNLLKDRSMILKEELSEVEYEIKFLQEKIDQCSLCPEKFDTQPNGIQQIKR